MKIKRLLAVVALVAAIAIPTAKVAFADSYKIGTESCYVEVCAPTAKDLVMSLSRRLVGLLQRLEPSGTSEKDL